MFIVLGFYKRRPDLTHEQFSHHWRNVHGPLMQRIARTHPYMIRYVQHHLSPDSDYPVPAGATSDTTTQVYDGFSEAWFENKESRDKWFALPVFKTEGAEDARQFLDMNTSRWAVIDEQHVIIPGPGASL